MSAKGAGEAPLPKERKTVRRDRHEGRGREREGKHEGMSPDVRIRWQE